VDTDFVKNPPKGDYTIYDIPIMRTAKVEVGREIVANVIALGAMIALTDVVKRESGLQAVLAKVPEAFIELNKKAYNLGFEKVKELMAG
jgi:2-oxoglutarate ferredoxin oxidoreductase subunit gamma